MGEVATVLDSHDGKALQSVAKGQLDLGALADDTDKQAQEQESGELKPLAISAWWPSGLGSIAGRPRLSGAGKTANGWTYGYATSRLPLPA